MKRRGLTLFLLTAFLFNFIVSCNDATEPSAVKGVTDLEGTWEIVAAEGDMADVNIGTVYKFSEDKLIFEKGGFANPGITEKTDSTFTFQAEGSELVFIYDYHFVQDTLVVSMQNSNGQLLSLIKK